MREKVIGKPCPRGHTLRYPSGGCVECISLRNQSAQAQETKRAWREKQQPGFWRKYQRKTKRHRSRRKTPFYANCVVCGELRAHPWTKGRFCSAKCRARWRQQQLRADPDLRQKHNESQKRRRNVCREHYRLKANKRYDKMRHDPGFIAQRRKSRHKSAERGKVAVLALKGLGVRIEPLPGYEANATEGRRIAALRTLKQLGIEV